MPEHKVTLTHVYLMRGVVSGYVTPDRGRTHRVGHLPGEGWFCTCPKGKRCAQIQRVKQLVPAQAVELGARMVAEGTAPGGACTPGQPGQASGVPKPNDRPPGLVQHPPGLTRVRAEPTSIPGPSARAPTGEDSP